MGYLEACYSRYSRKFKCATNGTRIGTKISKDSGMVGSHGPRNPESINKANIQLDNFVKILESHEVQVDRPTPIDLQNQSQHLIGKPMANLDQCHLEM